MTKPRGGLADKRRAILAGALTVFARDGYTRASIDAIATAAGVSTRTIYNHFADKAALFQAVIQESATRAAEAEIAIIDRHLHRVTDVDADLVEFALAWTSHTAPEHIALVRQVNAEAGHIPTEAIDAWQRSGPLRVRAELAARLATLAERGLLHITDPDRATIHFMLLVSVYEPSYRALVPTREQQVEMVTAGVRAFLHGYGS